MIEDRALVVQVGEGVAWVETQRQTTCGACSANKICGTATLATIMGKRRSRVQVLTRLPLAVGDEVIIGISERALVGGSAAVYVVPLLAMFAAAVFGEITFPGSGEELTILFGSAGLLGGILWLRGFTRDALSDGRFQPIVLKRLTGKTCPMSHG
jgi:sigma-E factor negative regulatory protein RseC